MCCLKMGLKLKVMSPQSDLHDIIYGIYYILKRKRNATLSKMVVPSFS